MVSLSLTRPIKAQASDCLYYGEFRYCAKIHLSEAWVLRYTLEADAIHTRLNKQQEWRERMRERWPKDSFIRYHRPITTETHDNLTACAAFIEQIEIPHKFVVNADAIRFYTNDIKLLDAIDHLEWAHDVRYSEMTVDRPAGTILLKNPQYKYRVYFKEIRVAEERRASLQQFLSQQTGVRIGPGLKSWLELTQKSYATNFVREYYFVDYSTESWPTLLALACPGIIRQTVQILAK